MITEVVNERGTLVLQAAFTDETGQAVTPTSITWSLTDGFGTAINGRTDVPITPPASTVTIVLTGADLAVLHPKKLDRYLAVTALYDSSLGSGLSIVEEYEFSLKDLKAKS